MEKTWINIFPNWYIAERQDIEYHYPNFTVYEKALDDGVLWYFGELIVRTSIGSRRQSIMLVYPEGFPYQYPFVVPLNELPEFDEKGKLKKKLSIKFFDQRHQMADGALCLFERETRTGLEGDIIRGIDILRRAEQWLVGSITGHWPPDCIESELEPHFAPFTDILLGKNCFSPDLEGHGRFCMIQDFRRLADVANPESLCPLIITLITRETNVEEIFDSRDDLSRVYPWIRDEHWGIQAFAELEGGSRPNLEGVLHKGYWWSLLEEPLPFRDGQGLLKELEKATDGGDSWAMISNSLKEDIALASHHFIGLRYPGRDGSPEWLVLLVNRGERDTRIVKTDAIKKLEFERSRVYCLRVHSIRDAKLRLRNQSVVDESVKGKTVALIGLGALGSSVAELLAKAGIGRFKLCDKDYLVPENVARHVGGINEFGSKKVNVVKRRLLEINPFLTFQKEDSIEHSITLSLDKLTAFMDSADLTISTIADDAVESLINQISVINNKATLYGWALKRANIGRVFLVRPGIDACKTCLSTYYRAELNGEETPEDWISIPVDEEDIVLHECGRPVIAGSGIDLSFISSLIARVALDFLEGKIEETNHWIWIREEQHVICEKLSNPMSTWAGQLKPNNKCGTCHEPEIVSLLLSEEANQSIISISKESPHTETGGVLIGFVDDSRRVIITRATGPGPKATTTVMSFDRDIEYIQSELERAGKELINEGNYVGEWHSHLDPDPNPSVTDDTSLLGIAAALNYLTRTPCMIIVGIDKEKSAVEKLKAWQYSLSGRRYELAVDIISSEEIRKIKNGS